MKDYTYSFEIKDLLTQFICAFDDIVIKRYDKDRNAREDISVRYVLAPKQRVMYDIVNKAQNLTLPVVAVNMTGISRDPTRVFNKLDNVYNSLSEVSNSNIQMPVPINIEVSMSILARYLQDMDQILSNFVPYNNPYIVLSWKEPTTIADQVVEIRSEVLWGGTINLTEPTDSTYAEKFRVVADTTFTIKGWLFKNVNDLSSQIYFIKQNFIPINNNLIISDENYDSLFAATSSVPEIETLSLSAIPIITSIFYNTSSNLHSITSNFNVNNQFPISLNTFTLYGNNFNHTTDVLLSASNSTLQGSLCTITSKYTGTVSGHILPLNYISILNDNLMTLTIPNLSGSCNFNIIINNNAGWGSSYDINNFTFTNT